MAGGVDLQYAYRRFHMGNGKNPWQAAPQRIAGRDQGRDPQLGSDREPFGKTPKTPALK